MRTPPDDLDAGHLSTHLGDGWQFAATDLRYAPVGFGSHHWVATDAHGDRRFVTVDELDADGPGGADGAFVRLSAALRTAHALREDAQLPQVVAPLPASDGTVLRLVGPRHALSLFPFVAGQPFPERAESTPPDRAAVVTLLARLHDATAVAAPIAATDDLSLAGRAQLEEAIGRLHEPWRGGPFAAGTRELLVANAARVGVLLAEYDRLASTARAGEVPWVVTHGEPKADNLLATETGPVLVDWDTALVAPAARDLWLAGSGEELALYTELTGRVVNAGELTLYRLRWDLTDIASYVRWFAAPHARTADTEIGWDALQQTLQLQDHWTDLV